MSIQATGYSTCRATFLLCSLTGRNKIPGPHTRIEQIEYWHGTPDKGDWLYERPPFSQHRVDAIVHESSTLHIGACADAPVDLDYQLKGTKNVFVTGGGLWPRGGSWNPTLVMTALALDLADKLVRY